MSSTPVEHLDPSTNPMIQLASASEQYGSFVETDAAFAGGSQQLSYNSNSNNSAITTTSSHSSGQAVNFHLSTAILRSGVPVTGTHEAITGMSSPEKKKRKSCNGSKQHQLPMFLTKTYHMIEKCDPEIATWSPNGDNFVVKHVEMFASSILPQYFKHSNFSSFARQLNFYGFRKLKAEPILTADYDARTASYVRFYHEKFQKDKPELLVHIKRATKSDVQNKDDVESLRAEIQHLNDLISNMTNDFDRRIAELSFEFTRKYNDLYNKFILSQQQHQMLHQSSTQQQQHSSNIPIQESATNKQSSGNLPSSYSIPPPTTVISTMNSGKSIPSPKKTSTVMMDNLAQACLSLKSPTLPPQSAGNSSEKVSGLDDFKLK